MLIIIFADYKDYLERMNTHTYEIVDAALRHPHLIVDVWGPGWAGYNKSIPLSANIRKRAHRVSQLEKSKNEFEKKQRKKRGNLAEGAEQEVWQRPDWLDVVPDECSDVRYDVVLTISSVNSFCIQQIINLTTTQEYLQGDRSTSRLFGLRCAHGPVSVTLSLPFLLSSHFPILKGKSVIATLSAVHMNGTPNPITSLSPSMPLNS